jgi:exonuclease V gamma subunit
VLNSITGRYPVPGTTPAQIPLIEQDESLMILACANPRREVEAVASLIWDWIRRDPDLRLNECAVIVHDMERYQHEIEQVFESIYNLPYHLIDGASGSAGRLEDAAAALLGLCFTEYTRRIYSL